MELKKEASHSLWLASLTIIQYNGCYIYFTNLIIQHTNLSYWVEFIFRLSIKLYFLE